MFTFGLKQVIEFLLTVVVLVTAALVLLAPHRIDAPVVLLADDNQIMVLVLVYAGPCWFILV